MAPVGGRMVLGDLAVPVDALMDRALVDAGVISALDVKFARSALTMYARSIIKMSHACVVTFPIAVR